MFRAKSRHAHKQNYDLSDAEYSRVLDNFVIGCVDVAVTYKGKIILEKRMAQPAKGELWIVGGRMPRGEEFTESAQRNLYNELDIDIPDTTRFSELGTYNLKWDIRREPHSGRGCQHVLVAYSVELTDAEYQSVESGMPTQYSWYEIATLQRVLPELQIIIERLSKTNA